MGIYVVSSPEREPGVHMPHGTEQNWFRETFSNCSRVSVRVELSENHICDVYHPLRSHLGETPEIPK